MFRRFRDGTGDPNRATLVTLLALITESVAWLTRWYLRDAGRACSRRPQKDGCTAPLCDLFSLKFFLCHTGVLFDDLQWHGRHGSDCCGVGTVSGSLGGCLPTPCFTRWSANDVLWQLRGCSCAGSNDCKRSPWVLAVCADSGQSYSWKRNICMQLFGASPSQLHVFVPERLRCKLTAHDLDGTVLLSGIWQRMLVMCSWLVDASVSHVEFVHGTNKRRACRSELWAHFISKHILETSCVQ